MTVVWVLLLALVGVVAAWALAARGQAKKETADLKAANDALQRQIAREREAYRREADRLEEISHGSDPERLDASIRILRELARGSNGTD